MFRFVGRQLARILINLLVRLWLYPRDAVRRVRGRAPIARRLDQVERHELAELLGEFAYAYRVNEDPEPHALAIVAFIEGAIARRLA